MHQSEWNELAQCADCNAEVAPGVDRGYAIGEDEVLCFACAVRRGAQWDPLHERWMEPPDLSGLPVESQPS